jgi:hypothetical protein
MSSDEPSDQPKPEVGLCSICRFAKTQRSSKEHTFWRCQRADSEPSFRRYPPLPVSECAGFEPDDSGSRVPPDLSNRPRAGR